MASERERERERERDRRIKRDGRRTIVRASPTYSFFLKGNRISRAIFWAKQMVKLFAKHILVHCPPSLGYLPQKMIDVLATPR